MSGFTGNDGSELAGGLTPGGAIKALSVDNAGNLNVNASVSSGPTNITQINGAAASATNGLPVSGNNSGALAVIAVDGSGRLVLVPNTSFNLAQIGGVAPGLDNTNEQRVSLYGKNAAAGDTPLLLDAAGHLLPDVIDRWARQLGQVDIARTLGAAISASNPLFVAQSQNGAVLADTNPEINISNIQQMILNGKGFSCSTGKIAAAANMAGSWFSPNTSTKNKLIYSIRMFYSNANQINEARLITADDANITAGTSVIGQAVNQKVGGAAPEAVDAMHYASAVTAPAIAAATEPYDLAEIQAALLLEVVQAGSFIYIPAGTAGGIACYSATTASGSWAMTVKWVEY